MIIKSPVRNRLGRGVWCCAALVATSLLLAPSPTALAEHPNVLLIVSDDQGWNDVGYHNPKIRSPHIDALANAGVELDRHYVMPQCTPTRVALMTGRYPSRFGLHCCQASNEQAFAVGTLTMARMLKSVGYATGMSGKWHLGSKPEWGPNHHGFDYSHGSLTGAVGMYDHRYRLDSPFVNTWHRNHVPLVETGHATDLTARETIKWIESHQASDTPWFFYVPLHAVHTPLVERDLKWSKQNTHFKSRDRRLFAAAVSHMDDAIGRMVGALDRTGQRERTLIIFTSDNGAQVNHSGNAYPPPDPKLTQFSSNKPLRGSKTQTYEGGYRVPAFVNWPAKLKPRKVTQPMHVVDWMPTLAGLVGCSAEPNPLWDGQDAWPLLKGGDAPADERQIYIAWGQRRQRESLHRGDWKIVRNGGKEWELYNLAEDPYEANNRAKDQPQRLDELLRHYQAERKKDAE